MNRILGRVRAVLEEAGKGQLERVGSQQLISKWRRLDVELSATSLAKVAEVLGINGHWLLTGQGDKRELGSGGGDAVFAAGVQEGLARAEKALHALRATSGGAERGVVAKAEQKAAGAKAAVEEHTPQQPPVRRRKREG